MPVYTGVKFEVSAAVDLRRWALLFYRAVLAILLL